MKRSKMVEIIFDFLILQDPDSGYRYTLRDASDLLDILESNGIRPPAVKKLHKPSGDIELYYRWEPEDEK